MNILSAIVDRIFHPHRADAQPSQGAPSSISAPTESTSNVDIEQILTSMAADQKEHLNWRASIVDLMKLLGLDSSMTSRKQLADELGFTGDTSDSASMNIWLHEAVMKKVAENGGKVPDSIKH